MRNPTVYTCPPETWIAREGAGLIGDDAELLQPAPPELLRPAPSKPLRISLPKLLRASPPGTCPMQRKGIYRLRTCLPRSDMRRTSPKHNPLARPPEEPAMKSHRVDIHKQVPVGFVWKATRWVCMNKYRVRFSSTLRQAIYLRFCWQPKKLYGSYC